MILPVFNTAAYLPACLDSLLAQDLPPADLEVVAVDDGSTDGSGAVLDEYARSDDRVQVAHQRNSGWPGQPRNRGIELSGGKYLFFMDSDDWVGEETMRRLCDFADEHGSDVVAPRMVRLGKTGRKKQTWDGTAVDAELGLVLRTLSPQKLFRRSFVDAHHLRFPEGKVRLEDGILVSRAYLLADRVSVLADYDYYYKRRREDSDNISFRSINPAGYVSSLRTILGSIRSLCDDAEEADELVLGIYRRKALHRLRAERFLRYKEPRRRKWVDAVAGLADEFVPSALQRRLPTKPRLLSEFTRRRDVEAVTAVVRSQAEKKPLRVVRTPRRLVLLLEGRIDPRRDIKDAVDLPDEDLIVLSWRVWTMRRVAKKSRRTGRRLRKRLVRS